MRVAWSGHKPELFENPAAAEKLVYLETVGLMGEAGPDLRILSGGQRGVDLWAATAARAYGLRLELLLPASPAAFCADWPAGEAVALQSAAEYAWRVVVFGGALHVQRSTFNEAASGVSSSDGYEQRNLALVEECDLLVVVWTGREGGGTSSTVRHARQLGRLVREHRLPASGHQPAPGEHGL